MSNPRLALLVLILVLGSCAGPELPPEPPPGPPAGPPPEPQAAAAVLTLAPHGPSEASGEETQRLLQWVRLQPERYVPALASFLDLERGALTDDEEARRRAQNAAMILVEHGGDSGRSLAVDALEEILTRQQALGERRGRMTRELRAPAPAERLAAIRRLDRDLGGLTELRNAILASLQAAADPRAAGLLRDRLRDNPDGLQAIAVPYLMKTAGQDPEVRAALHRLLADPQSTFFRNADLVAFLAQPGPGEDEKE